MAKGRLATVAVVALLACRGHHEEGPPALGKALDALLTAAHGAHAPWRCSALDTPPLTRHQTGDWTLEENAAGAGVASVGLGDPWPGKPDESARPVQDTEAEKRKILEMFGGA